MNLTYSTLFAIIPPYTLSNESPMKDGEKKTKMNYPSTRSQWPLWMPMAPSHAHNPTKNIFKVSSKCLEAAHSTHPNPLAASEFSLHMRSTFVSLILFAYATSNLPLELSRYLCLFSYLCDLASFWILDTALPNWYGPHLEVNKKWCITHNRTIHCNNFCGWSIYLCATSLSNQESDRDIKHAKYP